LEPNISSDDENEDNEEEDDDLASLFEKSEKKFMLFVRIKLLALTSIRFWLLPPRAIKLLRSMRIPFLKCKLMPVITRMRSRI
jgi:hypothetical protein